MNQGPHTSLTLACIALVSLTLSAKPEHADAQGLTTLQSLPIATNSYGVIQHHRTTGVGDSNYDLVREAALQAVESGQITWGLVHESDVKTGTASGSQVQAIVMGTPNAARPRFLIQNDATFYRTITGDQLKYTLASIFTMQDRNDRSTANHVGANFANLGQGYFAVTQSLGSMSGEVDAGGGGATIVTFPWAAFGSRGDATLPGEIMQLFQ